MGVDITLHIEKRAPGGWEIVVERVAVWRDYETFAALGLTSRAEPGEGPPIAQERGVPDGASHQVREDWERAEGSFAPSWLTLAELEAHRERLGACLDAALVAMTATGAPEDVRAVFWFTN